MKLRIYSTIIIFIVFFGICDGQELVYEIVKDDTLYHTLERSNSKLLKNLFDSALINETANNQNGELLVLKLKVSQEGAISIIEVQNGSIQDYLMIKNIITSLPSVTPYRVNGRSMNSVEFVPIRLSRKRWRGKK